MASPAALITHEAEKYIVNPDWINAEYAIESIGTKTLLLKPPHNLNSIARYKVQPDGSLKRVFEFTKAP